MPSFTRVLPVLVLASLCAGRADAAIQFFLEEGTVGLSGGTFTVSAQATGPGVTSHDVTLGLSLDFTFSNFGGGLATTDSLLIDEVSHNSGLSLAGSAPSLPNTFAENSNLLRQYSPNPNPFTITTTPTQLAEFSFLFPAGSSFTVALSGSTASGVGEPYVQAAPLTINATAVPEPGTMVALTCLAAGVGFRRRWSRGAQTNEDALSASPEQRA